MPAELAIGFFDGVHLGHRRLVGAMLKRARELGAKSVVYPFREPPADVLSGGRSAPPLLLPPDRRIEALLALGVDELSMSPPHILAVRDAVRKTDLRS